MLTQGLPNNQLKIHIQPNSALKGNTFDLLSLKSNLKFNVIRINYELLLTTAIKLLSKTFKPALAAHPSGDKQRKSTCT